MCTHVPHTEIDYQIISHSSDIKLHLLLFAGLFCCALQILERKEGLVEVGPRAEQQCVSAYLYSQIQVWIHQFLKKLKFNLFFTVIDINFLQTQTRNKSLRCSLTRITPYWSLRLHLILQFILTRGNISLRMMSSTRHWSLSVYY